MHRNTIEIIFVSAGRLLISDSALDYELKKGDIYIFNPGDPHRICPLSGDPAYVYTVYIDRNYYRFFFRDLGMIYFVCGSESPGDDSGEEADHLRSLIRRLENECSKEHPGDVLTESLATEMLKLLYDQFQFYVYRKRPDGEYSILRKSSLSAGSRHNRRAYGIVDYIYENFSKKLKLTDIASREYLSPAYVSRYLREVIGLTFSELLSVARCEEAERLLYDTEKTVDEISREVGFVNRKHLAVNFKKWYKKTPTDLRRSFREKQRPAPDI